MLADAIWLIAIIILLVSIVIQYRALNRTAFSRSLFISGMAFLTSFIIVFLALPGLAVWILFILFQVAGWGFLLFMTLRSWQRLRYRRKR